MDHATTRIWKKQSLRVLAHLLLPQLASSQDPWVDFPFFAQIRKETMGEKDQLNTVVSRWSCREAARNKVETTQP